MRWIGLIAACLLMGCSGLHGPVEGQSQTRNNVVSVDWDGNYYPLPSNDDVKVDSDASFDALKPCYRDNSSDACQDELQRHLDATTAHFDAIFEQILIFNQTEGGEKRIVLYIHGGLNSRNGALKRAVKAAGQMKDQGIYPIFINWRSGLMSSLGDHYFRIRDGQLSRTAPLSSPVYILGDALGTVAGAPVAWWKEAQHAFFSSVNREKKDARLLTVSEDGIQYLNPDNEKNTSERLRTTWWWVTSPVKIVTTPAVHTIGKPAWNSMLRRVDVQFVRPLDFPNGAWETGVKKRSALRMSASPPPENEPMPGTGATLLFAQRLQAFQEQHPDYRVTLIGHSMGGIAVNRVLQNVPDLRVDDVVFMASADTLDNFLHTSLPYVERQLRKGRDVRLYNLFLHPENEDREVSAWGFSPSGSLLVWIDYAFGDPDYILQRTAGRWSNMKEALPLIKVDVRDHVYFKVFGKTKDKCGQPQKHGAFDDCDFPFWDRAYWWQ